MWFDNNRRYINGVDLHSPDKTLNVTAVGLLHNTELPQYHGLPGLDAVAQRIPGVVEYLVRCVGLLLQRSTVPDGPILRTWVRAPLDYARNAVVSLNRRPFLLSHLKCGSHDTQLPTRRKLAGLHQVETTSSGVSTTSERMALLLEHNAEDPDAPLLTHTQNMLAETGITADEGNLVCSTFRLYP